jgi:hypothetical protein
VWGVWGVCGVCRVCGVWGSRPLLTFDIPQTALVATLDTYNFIFLEGARPGSASGCFKNATQIPKAGHFDFDLQKKMRIFGYFNFILF